MFGEALEGPVAEIVVRNCGFLITLVGLMLIHGAFEPHGRPLILAVASLSQLVFIVLVLAQGKRFLNGQAGIAIVTDLVAVALFISELLRLHMSDHAAV